MFSERAGELGSSRSVRLAAMLLLRTAYRQPAGGSQVAAQEVASSFDQLVVLVKPGDKIIVVDASGQETRGRIGELSRDALILVTSAGPRQLRESLPPLCGECASRG